MNTPVVVWRDIPDHETQTACMSFGDGHIHLAAHPPKEGISEVWTAQADLLDQDYRQVKFSGLLNGGDSVESARAAAEIGLRRILR